MKILNMHATLTLLIASIFVTYNAYADCSKDIRQGIQDILDKDRLTYQIPGMEVTISYPGENSTLDFVSGTTTLSTNIPVQRDNLFQIGSETKSFIAVILLQLEAEGLLSINDKIGKWLPQVASDWKEITIKQLLNHTSGIFNYTEVLDEMVHNDKNLDLKKQWTSYELINLVINKPSYFKPGAGWHYSNTNYVLAGMIIENATGKSVNDEIKTRLTEPLQLTNTYYLPHLYSEQIMQRMMHGYSSRGYFPNEPKDVTDTNNSWANAAGAIVSTSHDMAIWFKKLSSGALLPAKQMNELMTLVDKSNGQPLPITTNQAGYGLGVMHDFDTFGNETWWHSGGTLGYSSLMVWLKCSDIVITANINHLSSTRDIYALTKDLASYIQKSSQTTTC